MRILERLKDWFKEKNKLVDENMKIRKGKFDIEQKYNQMLEDMNEISVKYTNLLEQKSEQFDLYVKYQNQCFELTVEKKDLKKQLAETNEMCNSLTECNTDLTKQVEKLERKIKRMEKKNEQSA